VSNDGESFLVAYEANENSNEQNGFSVRRHAPAKLEKGDIAARARALDLARADFGVPTRPYNAAILPAGNGEWFVYLVPAQTRPDVFPLGGDVRYRVSADGRRILIKRRLHNSILEYAEPASSDKGKPVARFHTAVLDEIPEDTDVFHVLVRRPRVPEYVLTDKYVYRIDISGQIGGAGSPKDVLGPDGQLRIR
jgi:hypothetical protein